MELINTIHAVVRRGEKYYVCECVEIPVVTQGKTLDEIRENLEEAVTLYLEGEDLATLGIAPNPYLSVTFEWEPQYA
jgi:predicted RNase H-like HicB family nuclease